MRIFSRLMLMLHQVMLSPVVIDMLLGSAAPESAAVAAHDQNVVVVVAVVGLMLRCLAATLAASPRGALESSLSTATEVFASLLSIPGLGTDAALVLRLAAEHSGSSKFLEQFERWMGQAD